MSDETKIHVTARDGNAAVTILEGKNFVTLEDLTQCSFVTDDPHGFVEYVNNVLSAEGCKDNPVYASSQKVVVFPASIDRNTVPMAKLTLSESAALLRLKQLVNVKKENGEFTVLLKSLLKFGDSEAVKLYEFTRKAVIGATTEIRKAMDNQGNIEEVFSRKVNEKLIPEQISFFIPLYENFSETATFSLDVALGYTTEGTVKIFYETTNFFFFDEVKAAKAVIIGNLLSEIKDRLKFIGELNLETKDDSWRYRTI